MPETRDQGPCACCNGTGKHPVAAYLVPQYGPEIACGSCHGTGKNLAPQAVAE